MKPISFHSMALRDMYGASEYFDAEQPGLGDRFLAAVEAAIVEIKETPQAGAPAGGGACRKWPLQSFKHRIVYLEMPTYIRIIAVAHPSRRPLYWRRRLGDV